ncbi:hypothetical protein [Aquimarina agarivorans]|nr:hypothetical protein [Aquimarina agarivorans]
MAKIYSTQTSNYNQELKPDKETINFILSYSKAIETITTTQFILKINKN